MILNFNKEQKHHSLDNRLITVFFHVLLYRRSSILQSIYFLYRIRRFVSELTEYTPGAYSVYTCLTDGCKIACFSFHLYPWIIYQKPEPNYPMTAFFAYNKDDIDTKINSDFVWPVRIYTLVIRTGFRLLPKMGKPLVQLIEE